MLENWLAGMVYYRNLCSHTEHLLGRTMIHTLKGDFFDTLLGEENDNRLISYLLVLILFKKSLIPTYQWEQEIVRLMHRYAIRTEYFYKKQTTSPNEHNQNIEF